MTISVNQPSPSSHPFPLFMLTIILRKKLVLRVKCNRRVRLNRKFSPAPMPDLFLDYVFKDQECDHAKDHIKGNQ